MQDYFNYDVNYVMNVTDIDDKVHFLSTLKIITIITIIINIKTNIYVYKLIKKKKRILLLNNINFFIY